MLLDVFYKKEVVAHAQVSDEDYPYLVGYTWRLDSGGYVYTTNTELAGKFYLHRMVAGVITKGRDTQVDHINRDKLDNRKENLRIVTNHLNKLNNGKYGIEILTDCNRTRPYRARVKLNGRSVTVGYFINYDEAVAARRQFIEGYINDKLWT